MWSIGHSIIMALSGLSPKQGHLERLLELAAGIGFDNKVRIFEIDFWGLHAMAGSFQCFPLAPDEIGSDRWSGASKLLVLSCRY